MTYKEDKSTLGNIGDFSLDAWVPFALTEVITKFVVITSECFVHVMDGKMTLYTKITHLIFALMSHQGGTPAHQRGTWSVDMSSLLARVLLWNKL